MADTCIHSLRHVDPPAPAKTSKLHENRPGTHKYMGGTQKYMCGTPITGMGRNNTWIHVRRCLDTCNTQVYYTTCQDTSWGVGHLYDTCITSVVHCITPVRQCGTLSDTCQTGVWQVSDSSLPGTGNITLPMFLFVGKSKDKNLV